jgi:hypothetical protein
VRTWTLSLSSCGPGLLNVAATAPRTIAEIWARQWRHAIAHVLPPPISGTAPPTTLGHVASDVGPVFGVHEGTPIDAEPRPRYRWRSDLDGAQHPAITMFRAAMPPTIAPAHPDTRCRGGCNTSCIPQERPHAVPGLWVGPLMKHPHLSHVVPRSQRGLSLPLVSRISMVRRGMPEEISRRGPRGKRPRGLGIEHPTELHTLVGQDPPRYPARVGTGAVLRAELMNAGAVRTTPMRGSRGPGARPERGCGAPCVRNTPPPSRSELATRGKPCASEAKRRSPLHRGIRG